MRRHSIPWDLGHVLAHTRTIQHTRSESKMMLLEMGMLDYYSKLTELLCTVYIYHIYIFNQFISLSNQENRLICLMFTAGNIEQQ